MYIGKVAKITGLSIKAIRLYEERGLIIPSRQGRYRIYDESHIEILHLIKEAKLLGSTLSQLNNVIVYRHGRVDWIRIETFLIEMRSQLSQQVQNLNAKIGKVDECLTVIKSCPSSIDPPLKG